jgi:hypothetical protein
MSYLRRVESLGSDMDPFEQWERIKSKRLHRLRRHQNQLQGLGL